MVLKLTAEQWEAIAAHQGLPIFLDGEEQRYVLIPADDYQRIRTLINAAPFEISDTYAAAEQALGAAGWDAPAMDAYNDYDAHRPQT